MGETTSRLALPLIAPGQAQKEMTHNEALALLDIAVGASAVSAALATPPVDPVPGACWIIATGASGAWAGRDGALAGWTAGGWRFVTPRIGLPVWVEAEGRYLRRTAQGWASGIASGDPRPAPVPPNGGSVIDAQARAAIAAISATLQAFGLTTSG